MKHRNILITIEYDGTDYQGWQAQRRLPCAATVQETIENVLQRVLQNKIPLIGSGRTDAGVHAKGQRAHFKAVLKLGLPQLKKALNALLPGDIRIVRIRFVPDEFHARYDAKWKLYRYTVHNAICHSVFSRRYAMHFSQPLDVDSMRKAAGLLIGRHDFRSFQASDRVARDAVRTIKRIAVKKQGALIYIDIEADGFLYNMVRNIAGTLIEIGRGKIPAASMKKILAAKDRRLAGPTAPAQGLCLIKVVYEKGTLTSSAR
ncbi:MAG: tRNA pseudouridine(38-40) synthase TruA [Candidatus Omnitrophica bacterium]|nr:tRNA pseudouridine(38-40) synthase TruA [Candidatus Omnitrophota bacterium]MCG2704116.1 tRNA pseudouridine(38-40) synthase TruA [Candidatus Omnitrophota bacterium]